MKYITLLLFLLTLNLFAHDEGHGPKIKDSPKRGGRVSSVVLYNEASLGPKATLVYKAELIRKKANNLVMLYLYDKVMHPLKVDTFSSTAQATLISGKEGKEKIEKFVLKLVKDHYEGIAPKSSTKRYNLDVQLSDGSRELLAAFDNLD